MGPSINHVENLRGGGERERERGLAIVHALYNRFVVYENGLWMVPIQHYRDQMPMNAELVYRYQG